MATNQESKILKQMFQTTGLRPRLQGTSKLDNRGNMVYDTGDIVSPGSGEVLQIGSQLADALAKLPQDRTFQRLAERGKFEGTPLGELSMLGAPGMGKGTGRSSGGTSPDVGRSVANIRQTMDKTKKERKSSEYDDRGRFKGFGMLGTGIFGMPALEQGSGPLNPDRSPYGDVFTDVGPDVLKNLPGVLAVSGTSEQKAAQEEKKQAEKAKQARQEEAAEKQAQMMTMLGALGGMAGDRSFGFDDKGKVTMGAAPKAAAQGSGAAQRVDPAMAKWVQTYLEDQLKAAGNDEGKKAKAFRVARDYLMPEQPSMLGAPSAQVPPPAPPMPTIGGPQQQEQQQPLNPTVTNLSPQALSMVQQYQQMYPNKSPEEILQGMAAKGFL